MLDLKSAFNSFKNNITAYEPEEAHELSFYVFRHFYGISKNDLIISKSIELFENHDEILKAINNHEPIQYILGEAHFYDLIFKVNKHVLIPRPETEELVQLAISLKPTSLIDLGTGSGCIPISIGHNLKNATITAVDISEEALKVAEQNADINNVKINFQKADILNFDFSVFGKYDLLVSNPPYVKDSEKTEMRANVTDYEPHIALFVPDEDALIFYRKIAEIGKIVLNEHGALIVEINSALGPETAEVFTKLNYKEVKIVQDLFGKDRFVFAKP